MSKGYTSEPLSLNRKMVAASASVTRRKNTIHSLSQVDITVPRQKISAHYAQTGEKWSFTAYIVKCLADVLGHYPEMNSFIRRGRLILLEDVSISVLVERELEGEKVPEPYCIKAAQHLSYQQINDQVRAAMDQPGQKLGGLSGMTWIRYIPGFLLRTFVRIADKNMKLAKRYGKVAVTAVGMFSREPLWFIPHGTATVLITIGSIETRTAFAEDRHEAREFLCLTGSFDHNIVDGAPAARFMSQLLETIKSGDFL